MWKTTFNKTSSDIVCLRRPYHFKFFKGCLPQNFTWSVLEYLDPYNTVNSEKKKINRFLMLRITKIT